MKQVKQLKEILPNDLGEAGEIIRQQWKRHPFAVILFLALCLSGAIAPSIYAATGDEVTRQNAYALGILVLITFALAIYLFFVIFQPEKF